MDSSLKTIKDFKEEGMEVPVYGDDRKYLIKRVGFINYNSEKYVVYRDGEEIGNIKTNLWFYEVFGEEKKFCEEIYKFFMNTLITKLAEWEYYQSEKDAGRWVDLG